MLPKIYSPAKPTILIKPSGSPYEILLAFGIGICSGHSQKL